MATSTRIIYSDGTKHLHTVNDSRHYPLIVPRKNEGVFIDGVGYWVEAVTHSPNTQMKDSENRMHPVHLIIVGLVRS